MQVRAEHPSQHGTLLLYCTDLQRKVEKIFLIFHFVRLQILIVNNEQRENEIVIDNNLNNEIAAEWELKRNRQLSLQELIRSVDQYIAKELLPRKILAMNLDNNDEILKRRLAQ